MSGTIGSSGWDVFGVGANSVDLVNLLPGYPSQHGPLSKMRVRRQEICCGGQMATALSTCTSLGLTAKYVGVSGSDENGERVRRAMAERHVDTTDAIVRDAPNQFAVILIDEHSGERIVLWDRDERLLLRPHELPLEPIATVRLVHVDDVDQDAAIRAADAGRARGIPVTSDIDRLTDRTEALVAAVTVPIFAEHVPPALTGHGDQESALRALRARHDGLLVVTLGPNGVVALDGDRFVHVPAFSVPVVDTTGAGDVFRGGFIYGLLHGWPVERTLRFANAAAAVSCTRLGALNGVPTLAETTRLLEHAREA
jgi:sulfofructose kinase